MLLLVVFVFGSSVGSVCSCWVCSFVASISIDLVVFAFGRITHSVRAYFVVVVVVVVRFVPFEHW